MFRFLFFAFLSDWVDISVSVSRGGAINQRGYIVTGILRHRSHFGSRYKLGCCGHASLFGGGESLNICFVFCFLHFFQIGSISLFL